MSHKGDRRAPGRADRRRRIQAALPADVLDRIAALVGQRRMPRAEVLGAIIDAGLIEVEARRARFVRDNDAGPAREAT